MDTSSKLDFVADALLKAVDAGNTSIDDSIPDVLRTIREHLGMDVAFVSEFTEGFREFKYVDSASEGCVVQVGHADPLEGSYCQRVVDGRLPELMHDACLNPVALEIPATQTLPVRSHLSVPIYLGDGDVYGTFCCFNSSFADHTLDERDLRMMRTFATFTGKLVERRIVAERNRTLQKRRISAVIESEAFTIHYQPIFHLARNEIVGFESLSRFTMEPRRTPDIWFREAAEVGLGEQLEIAAINKALLALDHLPDTVYVALNSCPNSIISGAVGKVLERFDSLERIVLEVTEHSAVSNYPELIFALEPLRQRGLQFAVDDAGSGYASFLHILMLKPDIIKLDMSLIRGIDTNTRQQALAGAIISFADKTGSKIIAEGVETEAELETLKALGAAKVQGYLLGKPGELSAAIELLKTYG